MYGYKQCVQWCSGSILIIIEALIHKHALAAMPTTVLLLLVPV
jgi:hypothetical protein